MVAPALIFAAGALKAGSELSSSRKRAGALDDLADQFIQQGQLNVRDFERQSSARLASARTVRASSGVQISTGTSLIVDEESVKEIARGRLRIQQEAERRARALRKEAKASKKGGLISAGTSLLTAGFSAFG